jgi:hypothetical protein
MGLAVEVGYLADLRRNDEEGAQWFGKEMQRLNEYLASVKLPPHNEPEDCKVFSCDMYGYSGLHFLRRIAAHLDLQSQLPEPGKKDSDGGGVSEDPVLAEYFRLAEKKGPGLFDRLTGRQPKKRTFDHLILHSDAEGYYLPQDFPSVLFPPEEFGIAGGMIGSAVQLKEECKRLAAKLELPLDLDPEANEVWFAADSQGQGEHNWQRYGIESFTCLRLHHACERSINSGALIMFC